MITLSTPLQWLCFCTSWDVCPRFADPWCRASISGEIVDQLAVRTLTFCLYHILWLAVEYSSSHSISLDPVCKISHLDYLSSQIFPDLTLYDVEFLVFVSFSPSQEACLNVISILLQWCSLIAFKTILKVSLSHIFFPFIV